MDHLYITVTTAMMLDWSAQVSNACINCAGQGCIHTSRIQGYMYIYKYTGVRACMHKACIHVSTKVFILGYYTMRTFLFLLCDQMSQCVLHMIPAMGTLMWKENKMAALPQGPQLPSHVLMAMVLMEDTM